MNVLIIGAGGREHALLWHIKQSPMLKKLFIIPGREAISDLAECHSNIDPSNSMEVVQLCKKESIDLVAIGQEKYLFQGLADDLINEKISVFGLTKAAARLESSKAFTKKLCARQGIPTAKHRYFVDSNQAKNFVKRMCNFPVVIKADGSTDGKGVVICHNLQQAHEVIDSMLIEKKIGKAGEAIIIEEFLEGKEVSFFTLVDGSNAVIFPRLDSDLLKLLSLTANGKLGNELVQMNKRSVLCLVVANKGYPGEYKKGSIIRGLDKMQDVRLYHAGTAVDKNGNYIADGGRVLNIILPIFNSILGRQSCLGLIVSRTYY